MSDLYERDFYAWANEQAALLRAGKMSEADIEHVAEEIASMGRSEKRELINRLAVLLAHLLKWQHQPGLRGNSWRLTIREQRRQVRLVIADNPSLRSRRGEILAAAYEGAILAAQRETGMPEDAFPSECPWSLEQAMEDSFWP